MISAYFQQFSMLSFSVFLSSILFFLVGYALAPTVYFKKISWLLAYPMWVAGILEDLMKRKWHPVSLFVFIFFLNSISLSIDFFSGLVPFLPVLFAVWTGLNIGLITYHTLEGHFYFAALLNPVALLELPAAFITFTLALQYNLKNLHVHLGAAAEPAFASYLHLFLVAVLPLLFVAAVVESLLISYGKKMEDRQ